MKISGQIIDGKPKSADRERFQKWLDRNEGLWYVAEYKIKGKHDCPKTAEQLGYYWALLLPEIHKAFVKEGYTLSIKYKHKGKETECLIPYTIEATHEHLTALCGYVGEDGKHLRMSDMGLTELRFFIDHVIQVAVVQLGMNETKLKAMRPK